MSFIGCWLTLAVGLPVAVAAGCLLVAGALFFAIGWLPAILALASGEWAWGSGLAALWFLCAAFFLTLGIKGLI